MSEGNFSGMGPPDVATTVLRNFKANQKDKYTLVMLLLLALADIVAAPILFCLKADRTSNLANTAWAVVWTPLWVIDFVLLVGSLSFFIVPGNSASDGDMLQNRDAAESGSGAGGDADEEDVGGMNSLMRMYDFEQSLVHRVVDLLSTVSFVVSQVALVMKLDGKLDSMSWVAVGGPWYVYQVTVVWKLYHRAALVPKRPKGLDEYQTHFRDASTEEEGSNGDAELLHPRLEAYYIHLEQCNKSRIKLYFRFFWIWQTVFLVIKLENLVDWPVGLVLLPCWVYLAARLVASRYNFQQGGAAKEGLDLEALRTGQDTDVVSHAKAAHGERVQGAAGFYACCTLTPLLCFVLIACAWNDDSISTFWIFTPVWCVLSIVLCLNGCICLFCCCVDVEQLEKAVAAEMALQADVAKSNFEGSLDVPLTSATSAATPAASRGGGEAQWYEPPAMPAASNDAKTIIISDTSIHDTAHMLDLPEPPPERAQTEPAAAPTPPVPVPNEDISDLD